MKKKKKKKRKEKKEKKKRNSKSMDQRVIDSIKNILMLSSRRDFDNLHGRKIGRSWPT